MRRRAAITSLHQMKEINVIPMIDVMMFLLVVFIITMPLIENGVQVNLPNGKSNAVDQEHSRQVTIDIRGQYYIDHRPVTKEQLIHEAAAIAAEKPDTSIIVRGDAGVKYGDIMDVMLILNSAKLSKLSLATAPQGSDTTHRR